jgi:hypothetical protein
MAVVLEIMVQRRIARAETTLGKWLVEPTDRGWAAYYIEATDTVLTKAGEDWREHRIFDKQRIEWALCEHHATKSESETLAIGGKVPVEVWLEDDGFISICKPSSSPKEWENTSGTTVNSKDWEEYKAALPDCVREILKGCTEIEQKDKPDLMDILQSETKVLNICSDGGHINNRGSYGWVMATAGTVIYQGKGHAHGYPMSSYRAEANWHGYYFWIITANALASRSTAPFEAIAITWKSSNKHGSAPKWTKSGTVYERTTTYCLK